MSQYKLHFIYPTVMCIQQLLKQFCDCDVCHRSGRVNIVLLHYQFPCLPSYLLTKPSLWDTVYAVELSYDRSTSRRCSGAIQTTV